MHQCRQPNAHLLLHHGHAGSDASADAGRDSYASADADARSNRYPGCGIAGSRIGSAQFRAKCDPHGGASHFSRTRGCLLRSVQARKRGLLGIDGKPRAVHRLLRRRARSIRLPYGQ